MCNLKKIFSLIVVSVFLGFGSVRAAQSEQYYKTAADSIKSNPIVMSYFQPFCGKPVVVEFFSYGCYGCFKAEQEFQKYLASKASHVEFKRVPVVFNNGWEKIAKMYYAYEQLGVTELLHGLTFVWVQDQLKNRKPIDDESIAGFLNEIIKSTEIKNKLQAKGFTVDGYLDTLKSITVNRDKNKGDRLFRAYSITSTPSVVVNGKYVITLDDAKSFDNLIKAIQELTKQSLVC